MVASNEHAAAADCPICQAMVQDGGRLSTLLQELARVGYQPPAAARLDDAQLKDSLWQLIDQLAGIGVYLMDTNHFNDRELYELLIAEALSEEGVHDDNQQVYLVMTDPEAACHGPQSDRDRHLPGA